MLCDVCDKLQVANLLVISFDRYFSVTRPLTYRARRTPRRAAALIAGAWGVSVLIWTPWIWLVPYLEGGRQVSENDCFIQFLETNKYLTVSTAIAAFYLPVIIMCVLYFNVYRVCLQFSSFTAPLKVRSFFKRLVCALTGCSVIMPCDLNWPKSD
jgi:hypothetical protein